MVGFLFIAGVRLSSQRAHRLDASAHDSLDEDFPGRTKTELPIPVSIWIAFYARDRRALGNSSASSNAGTILRRGNRSTRRWPFICHDGRSWREFVRNVSPPAAILFRNNLYQFFPLVDQNSLAGEEVVATPG